MAIETPHLAVDGIIELMEGEKMTGIVLIERKNPPYGLAFPGGFVDIGESCESALLREMQEETSLQVVITTLLGVYSDPTRDPRFHTASAVYVCRAGGTPRAQDDAKALAVYPLDSLPLDQLVFDHPKIAEDYLAWRAIC